MTPTGERNLEETGTDPTDTFGTARAYDDTFDRPEGPIRRWGWFVVAWLLADPSRHNPQALRHRFAPPGEARNGGTLLITRNSSEK